MELVRLKRWVFDLPLDRDIVLEKIREKRKEIKEFESSRKKRINSYLDKIQQLDEAKLSDLKGFCGAKPIESGGIIKEFSPSDIENWVIGALDKKIVGGVDGSQIIPIKEYDIPIGLANAVLCLNNHKKNQSNKKKKISLVTPNDFDLSDSYSFSSEIVNAERDELEREISTEFIQEGMEDSFILLDGALVLSHANKMRKKLRKKYIEGIKNLLNKSKEKEVPVIGFIETSYSCDLIQMLESAEIYCEKKGVYDALIISELLSDGDRTKVFTCHRDDSSSDNQTPVLARYGEFQNRIAFFYLKLGGDICCRIEFPRWCYEEGYVDQIADLVRAESFKGNGYPLILNKAHKEVVINYSEKEKFEKIIKKVSNGNTGLKGHKKSWETKNVRW